jgi:hypothetical protein
MIGFFFTKMKDTTSSSNPNYTIIEVWSTNLEEEFRKIRKIIQKYPFVAMVIFLTKFTDRFVSVV